VCATVTGVSTAYGNTDASEAACANAGDQTACEFLDCSGAEACGVESWVGDGYCDDGTWGYYFNCDEFDCDGGDCSVECWDGSSACSGSTECPDEPTCLDGDVNGDGNVNVTDIVSIVNFILSGGSDATELDCGDMNDDGVINVTDIVTVVNYILGGGTLSSATGSGAEEAIILMTDDGLSVESEGVIKGIQLVLSHGPDFKIDLVDANGAYEIASQNRLNATTTIVVVVKEDLRGFIGTTTGNYKVKTQVVVNEFAKAVDNDKIDILDTRGSGPVAYQVRAAYPNPFNPSTTLEVVLPDAGYVSVKIYNLVGQEVATLADGFMSATGQTGHQLVWNASNMSSGVYLVKVEGLGQVHTQKLMLLK
jgi:hypothetical protein